MCCGCGHRLEFELVKFVNFLKCDKFEVEDVVWLVNNGISFLGVKNLVFGFVSSTVLCRTFRAS